MIRTHLWTAPRLLALALSALLATALLFASGCESDPDEDVETFSRAYRVGHRSQLIGGPTALGDVGDWVLENDKIRILVQDLTFNRGAGLFGGSLIDADLVRFDGKGNAFGGDGRDTFGELFPAFFLEVIDPDEIVIVNDGSDGEAAVLEVRGRGGEFVTMLRFFNHAMVNAYEADIADIVGGELPTSDGEPLVTFTMRYILEPGAQYVRMEAEMVNESFSSLTFPNRDIINALGLFLPDVNLSGFTVPTGMVLGFGALNRLFVPGIGYDIRFGMEDLYEEPVELPAIPGHRVDLLATSGNRGISYGFAMEPSEESNFVFNKPEHYEGATPDELLFLFYASGFAGAFTHEVPTRLAPSFCDPERPAAETCADLQEQCLDALAEGASTARCEDRAQECLDRYDTCLETREQHPERFIARTYFIVGEGDVSSVRDQFYDIRGTETFTVSGRALLDRDATPADAHTQILIYEGIPGASGQEACTPTDDASPYLKSQAQTNREGAFQFNLPEGQYCYRVRGGGATSDFVPFSVESDRHLNVSVPAPGRLEAFVIDETGRPVPAKITLVGHYDPIPELPTRRYLFDMSVGESYRPSEFVSYDEDDTSPRRYIEAIGFATADGQAVLHARPGTYTAYVSRGAEYDLFTKEVELTPGGIARVNARIHRRLNPDGYLSADLHLHAQGSIDSGLDYNQRVISVAAEGLEVAVATDHNYISDYSPYIYRNNLETFVRSIIGLELTTFEAGHFNAFPLRQDIAETNRGSIAWQDIPPQRIFDELRSMGSVPEGTIIQVNHPRDSLLGYFNQHYLDPLTAVADLPINTAAPGVDSILAAAISPNGPAFVEEVMVDGEREYRSTFSYDFDAIEIYNGKRIHLLRHFRMPFDKADMPQEIRDQLDEEQYDALPDNKGVILCDGDDVAYPGGLDDWYNFLNYRRPDGTYRRYTATANSDSHHAGAMGDAEPGFPKNYIYVGHNNPQRLMPDELVRGMQEHHVIITNGPFISMHVNDSPVGSTVNQAGDEVTLDLYATAVDWVGVERFTIVANGEYIYEGLIELDDNGEWRDSVTLPIDGDTWFVMEAEGDNNLFPVVQPAEIPQIAFDQVIGSLAGAFGFGGEVEGLAPREVTEIRPLAITNPIWVINDGSRSEFEPPEPPLASCVDGQLQMLESRLAEDFVPFGERRLDAQSVPLHLHDHTPVSREQGELRDARLIFEHWMGHSH